MMGKMFCYYCPKATLMTIVCLAKMGTSGALGSEEKVVVF